MACTICRAEGHNRRKCPFAPEIVATPRAPGVRVGNGVAPTQPRRALLAAAAVALLVVGGVAFYVSRPTPWAALVTVPAEKRNG